MGTFNDQSASLRKGGVNTCDVVLTTYSRPDVFEDALRALSDQALPHNWRIRLIVCDDGASSATSGIVKSFVWGEQWDLPIVLSLEHLGRSGARNAGIKKSSADVVLLLADDILLRPGALACHLRFHDQYQESLDVALGYVLWDPRVRPTPFMEWMTHGGQQNDYDALLGRNTCDPDSFFYGSHLSLKRSLIQNNLFSEDFFEYGWEDLELGSRLKEKGIRLHVLHTAIGLHRHAYTAKQFLERQRVIGAQKYKVNTNSIRRIKHALYRYSGVRAICTYVLEKIGNKVNIPRIFQLIIAGEFWFGVFNAERVLKRKSL